MVRSAGPEDPESDAAARTARATRRNRVKAPRFRGSPIGVIPNAPQRQLAVDHEVDTTNGNGTF
jgi:hypothetical protein